MSSENIAEKELKLLFPVNKVEIGGRTFELRPFTFIQTRDVAVNLKDVLHLLVGGVPTPAAMVEIYSNAFEGIRDTIAMCLKLDPSEVENFDMASTLKAITEIIRCNKDFFSTQVEAVVGNLTEMLGIEDEDETDNTIPSDQ